MRIEYPCKSQLSHGAQATAKAAPSKTKADAYSAGGKSSFTVKNLLKGALLALALPKGAVAGSGDSCDGYPLAITGGAAAPGDGKTPRHPSATLYFSGKNGLEGRVVANLQSEISRKRNGLEWYPGQLAKNMVCIMSAECGITATGTPNDAAKHIPGYLESTYYTAVYVNRVNDTQGLDPQVACIFDLGFKSSRTFS